jgi:hypothetical protein
VEVTKIKYLDDEDINKFICMHACMYVYYNSTACDMEILLQRLF